MKTRNIILFIAFFLTANYSAFSQTIDISGEDPKKNIVLSVEESTIADVLLEIGKKYQFEIKGTDKLFSDQQFSIVFQGNLESILQRLLKNSNHLIVRSTNNPVGIERIVILQDKSTSSAEDTENDAPVTFLPQFTKSPQK